jgi:hypothetical protein
MAMTAWTDERRKKQAERARATKPWEKSSGPKTAKGKARSSLNAYKHGGRCRLMDEYRYLLWLNRELLRMARLVMQSGTPPTN